MDRIAKKLFGNFIRIDTKDGKGGYLIQNTAGGRKIAAEFMKELNNKRVIKENEE